MAETEQQRATRRKYESDKSVKKMWIGRGITAAVVVLLGIVLYSFGFNIYLLFAKPDAGAGPMVWATKGGLGISKGGGEQSGYLKLPSQSGEPVENPRFAILNDTIVFYVAETNSLGVGSAANPLKWIPLGSAIPSESVVRVMRPIGTDSVLLVAFPKGADPESMPGASAAAKYTLGASTVSPLEAIDAAYGPNNKVIRRTASGFEGVGSAPSQVVSWDYDFTSGTLFASEGKSIACVKGSSRKDFGLGVLYFLRNVSAVDGELWVDAVKPFNSGHLLLAFGPDGSFKRVQMKGKLDIRPPYVKVSQEMADYLTHLSGGVQE